MSNEYQIKVDKISTEEKILLAEDLYGLEPWEIAEITQDVLAKLPESMRDHKDMDLLFDVVYEAINDALDRVGER